MRKTTLLKLLGHYTNTGQVVPVTVESFCRVSGLSEDLVNRQFPGGSMQMLMDLMEDTGKRWVDQCIAEAGEISDPVEKVKHLVTGYALGSEDHPHALSLYIDAWKYLRDSGDRALKKQLADLYGYYASCFSRAVEETVPGIDRRRLDAVSLMLTVLSDAIHIQALVLERDIEFDAIRLVLEDITALVVEALSKGDSHYD